MRLLIYVEDLPNWRKLTNPCGLVVEYNIRLHTGCSAVDKSITQINEYGVRPTLMFAATNAEP